MTEAEADLTLRNARGREFGVRVYNAKPLLVAISKIMGHADAGVRKEGTRLVVELYRYTSLDTIKMYTKDLKPVQVFAETHRWPCAPRP